MPRFIREKIKRLRVKVLPDGVIESAVPYPDIPDELWDDILDDPRARTPRDPGAWRSIGAQRDRLFTISCRRCGLNKTFFANDLIASYGRRETAEAVTNDLARCKRSPKACELRFLSCLPRRET